MASYRSIADLANAIAKDTAIVAKYFDDNGLAQPSFDEDGPSNVRIPPTAPDVAAAHSRVIEATRELNLLMQGPTIGLRSLYRTNDTAALQFIYRFKVAEHVPAGAEISFRDLAKATKLDEIVLTRFLRYAFTDWLFKETRPGFVGHTAASRLLHDSQAARFQVGLGVDENFRAGFSTVEALEKYGASQEPTESGWGLANHATRPFYAELALRHPERSAVVAGAMDAISSTVSLEPLFDVYDFSAHNPSGTIVDVGGGHGSVGTAIARRYPSVRCIVQDVIQAVEAGEAKLKDLPEDVQGRIKYQVHDIFEEQPVKGADIYYLRAVFHNWSDKYCIKMLRALIPALKKGARVVLNDSVLGDPGTMPAPIERLRRAIDLNTLRLFNGQERTVGDWKQLFAQADSRFALGEIRMVGKGPQAFMMPAVMEAVWNL